MSGKGRAAAAAMPDTPPRAMLEHALSAAASAAREAAETLAGIGARDEDNPASTAATRFGALSRASLRLCPAAGRASSVVEAIGAIHAAAMASAAPLDLGDMRAALDRTLAALADSLATAADAATDVDRQRRDAGTAS